MICSNAEHERHEIKPGDRTLTIQVGINWGDHDLRDAWTGDYTFCSFGCAEEWLGEKASQHDGRHVTEGTA